MITEKGWAFIIGMFAASRDTRLFHVIEWLQIRELNHYEECLLKWVNYCGLLPLQGVGRSILR